MITDDVESLPIEPAQTDEGDKKLKGYLLFVIANTFGYVFRSSTRLIRVGRITFSNVGGSFILNK